MQILAEHKLRRLMAEILCFVVPVTLHETRVFPERES